MKKWFSMMLCFFIQNYTLALDVQVLLVSPITSSNLEQERAFFYRCWHQVYEAKQGIGEGQTLQFLAEMFDQEEEDYSNVVENRCFFHVLQDGHIVGYLSCCFKSNGIVYMRQLALTKGFEQEVMLSMLETIFDDGSGIACVHIVLPCCATCYIDALKKCGFQESICGHRLNGAVALQWSLRKCGTCACDFDDYESIPLGPYIFYEGVLPHEVFDLDEEDGV